MADQATVDRPDEFTEEWGDAFTLKAYKAAARLAADVMNDIGCELSGKKRPRMKSLLLDTAVMIDTVELAARGAFEAITERGRDEDSVIAEITTGEVEYRRVRKDAAVIAEIVYERERLNRLWERVEDADGDKPGTKEGDALVEAWKDASLRLHESVFSAILAGKVDAVEAIRVMEARKTIDLNHTEHPDLLPADPEFKALGGTPDDPASDVRVLAEISMDIRTHMESLSEGSQWRAPLSHLADRVIANQLAATAGQEGAEA